MISQKYTATLNKVHKINTKTQELMFLFYHFVISKNPYKSTSSMLVTRTVALKHRAFRFRRAFIFRNKSSSHFGHFRLSVAGNI
jgi:hypothetical protein